MSFSKKILSATITLGTGNFGDTPGGANDSVNVQGLRISAQIQKTGAVQGDSATIKIWGLTESVLNQVSQLGKPLPYVRKNIISLSAGDSVAGVSEVFAGLITAAYADFNDPPNVCLNVTAIGNSLAYAVPVPPLSFPAGTDAVVIAQQIAQSMSKTLINWGVSGVQIASPYFAGTAGQQLDKWREATGLKAYTSEGQPLEIWPPTGSRGGTVPIIGPDTGLVGYPEFCDVGIQLRTQYVPGLNYGGQFQLNTSIVNAQGMWLIYTLSYDLESENPVDDAPWFADITANRLLSATP